MVHDNEDKNGLVQVYVIIQKDGYIDSFRLKLTNGPIFITKLLLRFLLWLWMTKMVFRCVFY